MNYFRDEMARHKIEIEININDKNDMSANAIAA